MRIYPAIDIKDGKCVRLFKGQFSDVTVYGDSPAEMAKKWESLGGEYIHVVDRCFKRSWRKCRKNQRNMRKRQCSRTNRRRYSYYGGY